MTEKTPNYTPEMEAALKAAAPISFADAESFGEQFGKSAQSVIAKVQNLGLEYIPKVREPKRPQGKTKAQLVAEIQEALNGADLKGLEKATSMALGKLVNALS